MKEFIYSKAINRNKGSNNVAKTLRIFTLTTILFARNESNKILDALTSLLHYYTITLIECSRLNTTYCFAANKTNPANNPDIVPHT